MESWPPFTIFTPVHKIHYVIGITGGSGSGKSFLIQALRSRFTEEQLAILSQDNYYKPREDQARDKEGIQNFDLPSSFLMNEFERDLKLLLKGETVRRTEYTYNNAGHEPDVIVVAPAPVLIIEGLFLLSIETIRETMDLKVFVDASNVVKVKRRILRDRVERNYPLEDVLYRYEKHVLPAYKQFIAPFKSEADVILNNNSSIDKALVLLSGFIRGLLG
jgi:uridine kinase